ncbi:hypothetical protein [Wukongibacter sp. M2B1]|uniref:hypothetical protein n=1 Tax=Wukongibacter sp. M2B1 TaxID=3088895 RepID=UPI003D7BCFF7
MKKKYLATGLIILFILTNIYTYIHFSNQENKHIYVLTLKGESENWKIDNYQIVYNLSKGVGKSGFADVYFLENIDKIDKSSVKIFVYDYFKNGKEPHKSSTPPSYDEEKGFFMMGAGKDYPPKNLTIKDIEENTYMVIEWKTKNGNNYKEKIDLGTNLNLVNIDHLLQ